METLGDLLPKEIARIRKLLRLHKQSSPRDEFGKTQLVKTLLQAEQALIDGDVVAMARLYQDLKEIK